MVENGSKLRVVQTNTASLASSIISQYGNESLIVDVSGPGLYLGNNSTNPIKIIDNLELDELNAILVDTDSVADDPIISGYITKNELETALKDKQDKLVDGVNIATINGQSLTAGGDLTIESGEGGEGVYITPFSVEQFCTISVEFTDEQINELLNAASQNRIIGIPYGSNKGYIVADYEYILSEEDDNYRGLYLGIIYNGAHYRNYINSNSGNYFTGSRRTITSFQPLMYSVTAQEGLARVSDESGYPENCIYTVDGECTELIIYFETGWIGQTVRFFTGESCTLEIGYPVYWANGVVPTIEPYTHYELSLVMNIDGVFNGVLTPFKPVE